MEISNELMTVFLLVVMAVVGGCSYHLGKRKSKTPKMLAVIGVVLSVIPLLGLIYLAALALKKDLPPEDISSTDKQ